jgi:hypothetical protein
VAGDVDIRLLDGSKARATAGGISLASPFSEREERILIALEVFKRYN